VRNLLILLVALAVLPASAWPQARAAKPNCAPVRFAGEVTRNQRYVHALPGNLEFRLLPSPEGWSIAIGRPGDRTEDYAGIATPPYHGVNAVFIEAWHFRNADNTGPNEGEVDAPGKIRDFSFVVSEAQYDKFMNALSTWSGEKPAATAKQRDAATNFLLNGPRRKGTLTIVDMQLGGLGKGMHPWFESMKFTVNLCFPPPTASSTENGDASRSTPPNKNP
jgi:hypothetical protein